jgi:hypothetical protein
MVGGAGGSVRTYTATPLTMLRPSDGRATHAVLCPSCGARVTVRVCSEREARQRRGGWLALAVAGAVLLAGLVALGGRDSGTNGAVVALGLFGGVAAMCVGFARWFREEGVAITTAERPSPFTAEGAEHLVGFPTIGRSTFTKRGRARVAV